MKKLLKLCLAVAALATMFGFASCSNDSSNDSTAAASSASSSTSGTTLTAADYKGKTFVSEDGNIVFSFLSESEVLYGEKAEASSENKFKILTYSVTDGKATVSGQTASLSGTTLTASNGSNTVTCTQISGSNGFGGKAFIHENKKMLVVFFSDSKVITAFVNNNNSVAIGPCDYTVSGTTASWQAGSEAPKITATISGDVLTEDAVGYDTYHLNLVK